LTSFVADTHALLWQLTRPERLGKAARRAFAAAESGKAVCLVPAIVLIEVALLHQRGRIGVSASHIAELLVSQPAYAVLPIEIQQCLEFAALVGIHDPMDRLIAAAARISQSRLLSSDEVFDPHVDRVWD
jgi:PIN domain nuclease of toxin-antitoxin system